MKAIIDVVLCIQNLTLTFHSGYQLRHFLLSICKNFRSNAVFDVCLLYSDDIFKSVVIFYRIPLSITCTLYIKIGFVVSKQGRIAGKASDQRKKRQDEARRRRIIMVNIFIAYSLLLFCLK